jgi:hypothetical protein
MRIGQYLPRRAIDWRMSMNSQIKNVISSLWRFPVRNLTLSSKCIFHRLNNINHGKNNTLQNKSNQLTNNGLSNVGYITERLFPHWIRSLVWSLQLSPAPYKKFGSRIAVLWKANGVSFTVQYLKECTRIVQHFVSGHPVLVTDVMPIGLAGEPPTIIPGSLRTLLRSKDHSTIRGVLSTLAVYRIINGLAALGLEIPEGRSRHLLTLYNPIIYLLSAGWMGKFQLWELRIY